VPDITTRVGKRIRSLRKSKGLTQQRLGELSGLDYKYLGSIERGLENPSLRKIGMIASGLGIDVMELFRFHHEHDDDEKLREDLRKLVDQMENGRLRDCVKLVRALIH
jgi:transcriptional regulator with XRE-family HTH domain